MGKINAALHSLTGGEVSTSALARVDQERLRLAAEIQENLFPHVIGKAMFRPGTQYLGATASNARARFLPFVKAPDDTALVEMTGGLMRVWIGDAILTRPSVTSSVTNGDFASSAGWTLSATEGASATISSGLFLSADARGSSSYAERAVNTSTAGTEHALRIVVSEGPAVFRCGSSSGADDYIGETSLDTGTHSLSFTPSGNYYVRFINRTDRRSVVTSIQTESAGVMTITAPWTEADLPLIRHAQSIDIIYLACASWQQRKIERRGSTGRSWSLVNYETDDGPFVSRSTNKIRISASASYGLVTLTSTSALFSADHVGALLKVEPEGFGATYQLAGEDVYSDPVRSYGAGTDTNVFINTTGTWVGTAYVQRSFDSRSSGFADMSPGFGSPWQFTTNRNQTYTISADNVAQWVRVGFKAGTYTSGAMNVTITYGGSGQPGVYRILSYSSSTSVTAKVLSSPGTTASTDNWSFGAWSDVEGWPSAVGLFDGRLFWGSKDKFWGSESDGYTLFNLDDEGDSGSIQRAIATGGTINRVKWMLPLQRLILGTDGAEVSIRSSSFDEPLTPTNVTLKDASTQGAAAFSPIKMDGRGVFIHRDGVRLFEVVYDTESNDYRAGSLMLLNDIIGGTGFTGMAVQRSPETYIWTVRADGQCPILIYEPKEKTAGWIRFIAGPSAAGVAVVEDVVVLPSTTYDRVYLAVRRTINGSTTCYLEKLATHAQAVGGATTNLIADSHVTLAGPVTTFTGLTHLVGETVVAWGTTGGITGPIGTTYTVNGSGEITLPSSSTNVTVGLSYDWRFKSAKLAYAAQGGTALLQVKRAAEVGVLLENTHPNSIQFGSDFTTMYELPRVENGQDITETTLWTTYDEQMFPFGGGWDTDSRLCMKGSAPYPATIAGVVLGIETNES